MPHKMCYLNDPSVLWLNVTSDLAISLAYYLIPFLLFYFTRRRRDIEFHWIFVAFGVYGCTGCGGVGSTFADDFVIDAAVAAVPEPGTLALVGLGVLGAAARIRRRRQ